MDDVLTIDMQDDRYPALLREIAQPPEQLYVRGALPEGPALAIVGTRKPTTYGKQITTRLAGELARAGLIIVSGLAYGIDALAHEAALEHGGRTIAVLGTGPDEDSLYPRKHIKLARRIIESGGAVISEYAPGTEGRKYHFPARNRIIAGMSLGTLVVEAKQKSGALITTRHATDENRDVFAVPGPITSPESVGPNRLIETGATPALSPQSILDVYGQTAPLWQDRETAEEEGFRGALLDVLGENALHIDAIAEAAGMPAHDVLAKLTQLELSGRVKNLGNSTYART